MQIEGYEPLVCDMRQSEIWQGVYEALNEGVSHL